MGDLAASTGPTPKRSKAWRASVDRLAELLEARGLDVTEVVEAMETTGAGARLSAGTWTTGMKMVDADGNPTIEYAEQSRAGWQLDIPSEWADGPQWELIQRGPEFKIGATKRPPSTTPEGWRSIVCLPDIQAPFQDERALDVALQIVALESPDVIVMHGDNIDAPELSRFRQHPSFAAATQHAIDRMTLFCAELRATAGPDCEIVWIQGNHEARLQHYVLDNAAAAYGISRGKLPDEDPQRPVLAVPELCRLEESGVEYLAGYPANTYWFQPNVRVIHGTYTGKAAAGKYLAEGVTSIWGHTHHANWSHATLADGRRIYALSAGALCAVDGSVPGTLTGYDFDGPIRQPVNWDQGVVVGRGDGDQFWPELVPIVEGVAVFRGERLTA